MESRHWKPTRAPCLRTVSLLHVRTEDLKMRDLNIALTVDLDLVWSRLFAAGFQGMGKKWHDQPFVASSCPVGFTLYFLILGSHVSAPPAGQDHKGCP